MITSARPAIEQQLKTIIGEADRSAHVVIGRHILRGPEDFSIFRLRKSPEIDSKTQIRGWEIARTGFTDSFQTTGKLIRSHRYSLRGFYSYSTAPKTEEDFNAWLDKILNNVAEKLTLNNATGLSSQQLDVTIDLKDIGQELVLQADLVLIIDEELAVSFV